MSLYSKKKISLGLETINWITKSHFMLFITEDMHVQRTETQLIYS